MTSNSNIQALKEQIQASPQKPEPYKQLAEALKRAGELQEAENYLAQAMEKFPERIDMRFDLAQLQLNRKNLLDCQENLKFLCRTLPDEASVWLLNAMLMAELGNPKEMVQSARRALARDEKNKMAKTHLGLGLYYQERYAEAIEILSELLAKNPEDTQILQALSHAQLNEQLYDEAIAGFIELDKKGRRDVTLCKNLGLCYHRINNPENAIKWYREALELDPADPAAHYSLGMVYLAQGEYVSGWEEYEHRWEDDLPMTQLPKTNLPRWQGENLKDKRILVTGEQGTGDNVQFVRFLPLLKQKTDAEYVAYLTTQNIKQIFEHQPLCDELLRNTVTEGDYDYYTPLLSLMALLKLEAKDIAPKSLPYIGSDPEKKKTWLRWLELRCNHLPKVGICWKGNDKNKRNPNRSIPFEHLLPVLEYEGVQWVSLQYEDETDLRGHGLENKLPSPLSRLHGKADFSDTVALIDCMDMVITVDTSVAHISGALNKPVWTLLSKSGDWRYFYEGEKVDWYPSMRLIRNLEYSDWSTMTKLVLSALEKEF